MNKQALLGMIGDWMASTVVCGGIAVSLAFYSFILVSFTRLFPVAGIVMGSVAAALVIRWTIRRLNRN